MVSGRGWGVKYMYIIHFACHHCHPLTPIDSPDPVSVTEGLGAKRTVTFFVVVVFCNCSNLTDF